MSEKISLTSNSAASLPPGSYYDAKQPGLMLVVSPTSRIWRFYGWLNGKPVKKTLGRFPDLTPNAARIAASEFATARRGEGVKATYPKLGEVAATYSQVCATIRKNRTDHMADSVKLNWSALAQRRLDQIEQDAIQDEHDRIAATRGPAAARRAVKALRTLYNFAIRRGKCKFNPAAYVEIAGAVRRNVALESNELAVFHRVVELLGSEHRDFFKLAVLTGLRRSNLLNLHRDWVKLDRAMIVVPAEFAKSKKVMSIPVCAQSVAILRGRMACSAGGLFSFHDVSHAMLRLRQLMREHGVEKHFTLHDLRRTYAAQLTEKGAPLSVVAHALGHSSTTATPIYTQAVSLDAVRKYL